MPHKRQEIRDQIKTLLTPLAATVDVWRVDAYDTGVSMPAINIFDETETLVSDGDEDEIPFQDGGSYQALEMSIDVVATGASGETVANALDDLAQSVEVELYNALQTFKGLGVIYIDLTATEKVVSEPEQETIIGLLNQAWMFYYEG